MNLVNLGCGTRFSDGWVNIDTRPVSGDVIKHDLRNGIPLPAEWADVVYCSHVFEHLAPEEVPDFLYECYRVLRNNGIFRIVVPDLERIARDYLRYLESASGGDVEAQTRYDWIILELLDQLVRTKSGGRMFEYFMKDHVPAADYVISRIGREGQGLMDQAKARIKDTRNDGRRHRGHRSVSLGSIREGILSTLLGPDYDALRLGRFRLSGEVHQWMYDRYSLRSVLEKSGFQSVHALSPVDSGIEGWAQYQLDADQNGMAHKPDSMYLEGTKSASKRES